LTQLVVALHVEIIDIFQVPSQLIVEIIEKLRVFR